MDDDLSYIRGSLLIAWFVLKFYCRKSLFPFLNFLSAMPSSHHRLRVKSPARLSLAILSLLSQFFVHLQRRQPSPTSLPSIDEMSIFNASFSFSICNLNLTAVVVEVVGEEVELVVGELEGWGTREINKERDDEFIWINE